MEYVDMHIWRFQKIGKIVTFSKIKISDAYFHEYMYTNGWFGPGNWFPHPRRTFPDVLKKLWWCGNRSTTPVWDVGAGSHIPRMGPAPAPARGCLLGCGNWFPCQKHTFSYLYAQKYGSKIQIFEKQLILQMFLKSSNMHIYIFHMLCCQDRGV